MTKQELKTLKHKENTDYDQINLAMEERDRLSAECHQLVDAIARHPYSLKLLTTAKTMLSSLAAYKSNRFKVLNRE